MGQHGGKAQDGQSSSNVNRAYDVLKKLTPKACGGPRLEEQACRRRSASACPDSQLPATLTALNLALAFVQLLIDGKWEDAAGSKTFEDLDPRTGEKLVDVAEAQAEDVDRAVRAAKKCLPYFPFNLGYPPQAYDDGPWPRMTAEKRSRVMFRLTDLVESKTIDVPGTAQHFRYFGGFCDKIEGSTIPVAQEGFTAYTLREPIGVVGQIIPWNFPILMAGWKLAPALAAGCTIVLKVSQYTPLSALRLGELALEAGVPPGVLNILPGKGSVCGDALATHPLLDKVAFTGSTDVGRRIMEGASQHIKPVTLELGGNSPVVVCGDADLEAAVRGAHEALFFNMGQACECGARLFVQEGIYDEFVRRSIELAKNRKVGDPFDETSTQGPLVSQKQVDKVLKYVELGKKEGAKLGCGGGRWGDQGFYVEPTLFYDVEDDMAIARDEIFGPVQVILKFGTIDEVIRRANATEYGLAGAVWTQSIDTMQALTRGIKAGTVWVNTHHVMDAAVPFGGYKSSGYGREHGGAVLEHYTQAGRCAYPGMLLVSKGRCRLATQDQRSAASYKQQEQSPMLRHSCPLPLQTKSVYVPLPKSKEQRSWVIM
ncbi:hypothetical protein CHLNCDRAFT_50233 [Chlorella variabilis]|uniref:Aldehyde dehydrogenase domain-containing protein n=1 Tax=Chlorella variabilis TaxID=554065 RepID=E1Z5G1_CHLVA|nr:hypothetical protein CHLNCDRAFT_50233 [Chlorella variabilis]EFN58462.1 hypothetical protein CHLNCDRAFT_50233 [Chlorella variabilis]|eukprot:XP_005850564.1 hypothetical protein CHLNCDRAFT_50233 [Chlorella variabilis]